MSYDFGLCQDEKEILRIRNNDDDDCEPVSRKPQGNYHHYQYIRRRIPKRYSDIVGPASTKVFLSRKDSTNRERHHLYHRSSVKIPRHHSLKPVQEPIYYYNSSKRKSRDIKDPRYHPTSKHNDHLAHRMQAAMSSELMNSLDRNFVLGDRRQLVNHLLIPRSQSFQISNSRNRKAEQKSSFQLIPRVKLNFKKENIIVDEPTPDYDEQDEEVVIRTIENVLEIGEEPVADYDDSRSVINGESEEKTMTHSGQGASSSFIVPQALPNITAGQGSAPPLPPPPPLPNLLDTGKKYAPFRCRTIADGLSTNHKLILKDEEEPVKHPEQSQLHYIPVSKELTLRKISQTLSRSHSLFSPISQSDEVKSPPADEQSQDGQSSSSPTTSAMHENEYEHRSSSSKIYHEYKKRTSLTAVPTTMTRHQSMLLHPMHTRIGLRSSTSSSSTNEKLTDLTLTGKQMNVCVINQLNEHLSTRFRKQEKQNFSTYTKNQQQTDRQSYDPPPAQVMSEDHPTHMNVYDEPSDLPVINQICSPSIPPPPPPLPVGGFRPIPSSGNRTSNSQRTSILTLSRDGNHLEIPPCSNGTSTISSNLSDTRILRELRDNPLFTRAKQHLEIEPDSNGRRSNAPMINLPQNDDICNGTETYLRLDTCSKSSLKKSLESTIVKQLETIIILPSELDPLLGKQPQSTHEINSIKSRSCPNSTNRQSELELIFQKRAQRSEQNLT